MLTPTLKNLEGQNTGDGFSFRLPGRKSPVIFKLTRRPDMPQGERVATMTYEGMTLFSSTGTIKGLIEPETGKLITLNEMSDYFKRLAFEFLANMPEDEPFTAADILKVGLMALVENDAFEVAPSVPPDYPLLQDFIATSKDTKDLISKGADIFALKNNVTGRTVFVIPFNDDNDQLSAALVTEDKTLLAKFPLIGGQRFEGTTPEIATKIVEHLLGA